MNTPIAILQDILKKNRTHNKGGLYSVCCSHEDVLIASLLYAKDKAYPLAIESTSNQVNQFGGYTGMRPDAFVSYIYNLADRVSFPKERIVLGGDHLGPNAWQDEPSAVAMKKSEKLISDYVRAGYRKIHIDTSMACADDKLKGHGLGDDIVASRAARLCKIAEDTWREDGNQGESPVYIIGTEVPVPGGSKENEENIEVTKVEAAQSTYAISKAAFMQEGLESAWERVIAMVVQPGVEFSDDTIYFYNAVDGIALSSLVQSFNLVYEAHSTDYQTKEGLRALVENHYAILKVGPWLTYAYREAMYALAKIEAEMTKYGLLEANPSNFIKNIEGYINQNPTYWKNYYHGTQNEIAYKCLFSLSDRIRYYWPIQQMEHYVHALKDNLRDKEIPYSLVSQYFPTAIEELPAKESTAQNLITHRIQRVLSAYDFAVQT